MNHRSNAFKPREDAGRASAEGGVVVLEGPDGVAVTMTADAAVKTADSLLEAAREARRSPALETPDTSTSNPTDPTDSRA